jgi:hypothetical protein
VKRYVLFALGGAAAYSAFKAFHNGQASAALIPDPNHAIAAAVGLVLAWVTS